MSKANKKKAEQLGMNHSTANARLRKDLIFYMMRKLGEGNCYQCGEEILSIDDMSIEHKEPWLDSEDPVGLFFNIENIAFSHLSCNVGAARRSNTTITYGDSQACNSCGEIKKLGEFDQHKARANGYVGECKDCRRIRDREYKKQRRKAS